MSVLPNGETVAHAGGSSGSSSSWPHGPPSFDLALATTTRLSFVYHGVFP